MDKQRIKTDLNALQNTSRWGEVELVKSTKLRGILIHDFPYPEGWEPRRADLMLHLPDAYPRQPPDVYVPKPPHLEYTAGTVNRVRIRGSTDDWYKWCIRDVSWTGHSRDLGAFLASIRGSLTNPDEADPFKEPDDPARTDASRTNAERGGDSGGVLDRLLDGGDTA